MGKGLLVFILALLFTKHAFVQDISKMQEQLKHAKQDTAAAGILNNVATYFYNNGEYDSCKKYAAKALQLTDLFLNSPAAKKNTEYTTRCKIIKAQAIMNIGSALYNVDVQAGMDTIRTSLRLWKETGNWNGVASVYSRMGELCTLRSDNVSALKYYDTCLNLYKKAGDKINTAYTYYLVGLSQRYMSRYGDALENNMASLTVAREIKDTSVITLSLLANGFLYMFVKDYEEAQKNQQAALTIFLARNDSFGIATVNNDLGVTNFSKGNLDTALANHLSALAIRKQIKDYIGIGNSCGYISEILQQQKKYEQALATAAEALRYAKLKGNVGYIIDAYNITAGIYRELHDDERAIRNYDTILQVSRRINDRRDEAEALENIAEIYLSQGKTKEALTWLQKSASIAEDYDFKTRRSIYQNLSTAYAKNGDYRQAYESSIKFKQYSDSVAANEKAEKLASITNQLEFESKQALLKASQDKKFSMQQSQIEKQKLVRNITIAGFIIAGIFAAIFFIRFREKRRLNIVLEKTVADLKAAQQQLVQSEKMASLGELTAGISHEIQNPLNFVNNFSEVNKDLVDELKAELATGNMQLANEIASDIKENSEKIIHHGKRADAIVKGMLQHSRKSSGQKEPTNINALCDEFLRLSYHGLRAKDKSFKADFKTDFDESIGKINIIPQDIGRVILNLINNAFYAASHNPPLGGRGAAPTVWVSTSKIPPPKADGAAKILISVRDNGPGIPEEIVDKIFQPFFTTKPTGQGTGLGLSLSHDIVKAHGGEIKVKTTEGIGTEFIIALPC